MGEWKPNTRADQIAEGVYRLSTHVPDVAPPAGFTFNQFLILADQPMLYHCGPRWLFPHLSAVVARLIPLAQLRWISFGHVEADECGAMNEWLAASPQPQIVYSCLGCEVSVNDLADRQPLALAEGEILDLGDRRMRFIPTPHVPHGWEAQVAYEETGSVLFCGDIFTHLGYTSPITAEDIVGPAMIAEDIFRSTSIGPLTAPTLRRLSALSPAVLAIMHGASFNGDASQALLSLADRYEDRLRAELSRQEG